jgi:hypothetical protein
VQVGHGYRARALALRHCPAIGLAALSALLTPCRLLPWCLPFQNALADHLLVHVFLHVRDLLTFHFCDASLLQVQCPDPVTLSPSTACVPENVRQV